MVFVYEALNAERSGFRLVRFVDCEDVADPAPPPIHLELCHASLSAQNIHYKALSYAWGDLSQHKAAEVYINGELFIIGSNLHAGLAQLRQNGVQSWMWVDSICINQSDYEEKTWQVAQMGAIFTQAELVYIWLGQSCDKTGLAMGFISSIGPRALALGLLDMSTWYKIQPQIQDLISELASEPSRQRYIEHNPAVIEQVELARFAIDLFEEPGMRGRSSGNASLVDGINRIFQQDYWYRIWVIQEVALANDAVVLCGTKAVPINSFHAACNMLQYTRTLKNYRRFYRDFGKGLSAGFGFNTVLVTRQKYQYGEEPVTLASIVVPGGLPPRRPFYSASDPRDIVFGILGIIPEQDSFGLRSDYGMTSTQVFIALTRALIRHGEQHFVAKQKAPPYHFGSCVPREEGSICDMHLPSWVPDWIEVGIRGFIGTASSIMGCSPSRGMPLWTSYTPYNDDDEQLGRIRMYGCRVDVITEVMQPPRWISDGEWSLDRVADPAAYLAGVLDFTNLGPVSSPGEDHVWRTITMDPFAMMVLENDWNHPFDLDEDIAWLIRKMARREPIQVGLLTSELKRYVHDYAYGCNLDAAYAGDCSLERLLQCVTELWQGNIDGRVNRGRTLFKTAKSMLGHGHTVIQPGDVVTLMGGVESPIILRPRDEQSGGGFRFVGDAYIDGIMFGEFLKTSPVYETFHIY